MINPNPTPNTFCQRQDTLDNARGQTPTARPEQQSLLDYGQHAARTRAIAAASAMSKAPSRRDAIELHVAGCGRNGATRWELSEALSIPYTSVCSPVQSLVLSGRLRETEQTRPTAYGKPAAVIVSGLLPEVSG